MDNHRADRHLSDYFACTQKRYQYPCKKTVTLLGSVIDVALERLGHVGDNRAMRIGAHPLTTQAE
jgi:hypothetical protein